MSRLLGALLTILVLALAPPLVAGVAARDLVASELAVQHVTAAGCRSIHPTCSQVNLGDLASSTLLPAQRRSPTPVTISAIAGYAGQYRTTAWVPVRVTLHNHTATSVPGTVSILDQGIHSQFAATEFGSMYQSQVILPPSATKVVTLYLPGRDAGNGINVQFTGPGKVQSTASTSVGSVDPGAIVVGTLTDDLQYTAWLNAVKLPNTSVSLIPLHVATLDPKAESLATFDAIILSNTQTSRLDRDQLHALSRYVHDGGSLILVGGRDWQETLGPLPANLLPGVLTGSRVLPNLSGLRSLAGGIAVQRKTVVSVLTHPRGTVLASQQGTPLVVRTGIGQGLLLYMAFDPAIDPVPRQGSTPGPLADVVLRTAPQIVNRMSVSGGFQSRRILGRFGPDMLRSELTNAPSATLPSRVLIIAMVAAAILLLGPVNFLVLHRMRRRELAWVTIPTLSVLCFGSTFPLAAHFKGNLALLNTVSMVELDSTSNVHSVTMYTGLFAPLQGDYHLVWNGFALPQILPQYNSDQTSPVDPNAIGARFQEGSATTVDLPSMKMWSTRAVALKTTVTFPGTVGGNLHLTANGTIAGTIHNSTSLTLSHAAIIAGHAVLHLADLPPRTTLSVRIQPNSLWGSDTVLWDQVYGASVTSGDINSWDGDPWEEPPLAPEISMIDRIRNVAERLPESRDAASWGQILFIGWSQDALGTFTVNGSSPQRRDLNLIVSPLSVKLSPGSFQLRPGTLGAYLINDRPQQPQSLCCDTPFGKQSVSLGPGGSATYEFDVPTNRPVHFGQLWLAVDAGGADQRTIGQVFDWRSGQWVHVPLGPGSARLPSPDRFVSPTGALLVKLQATKRSGDILIRDPRLNLQLYGLGTAR